MVCVGGQDGNVVGFDFQFLVMVVVEVYVSVVVCDVEYFVYCCMVVQIIVDVVVLGFVLVICFEQLFDGVFWLCVVEIYGVLVEQEGQGVVWYEFVIFEYDGKWFGSVVDDRYDMVFDWCGLD